MGANRETHEFDPRLSQQPAPIFPRRLVLQGAAGISAAALLAACGSTKKPPANDAPVDKITVTDQRDKSIVLNGPAQRVVTFPQPAAAMLIAVDSSTKHLAGMNEGSWTAIRDGLLGELFPEALKIPHDVSGANFSPNVESVLRLKPDMVIQWADQGTGITAPLEDAGLNVAGLTYGTQKDVDVWIDLFAKMLGKPERATAMLSEIHGRLAKTKATAADRPKNGPKILYFFQFKDGMKVAGKGTYNDYYIDLVGARNAATIKSAQPGKNDHGQIGADKEGILTWDPDIILLGNFDTSIPDDVYKDPVFKDMSAVKTRRVYKVPLGGYRWDPPGQESPLMWQWLSEIAFPQATSNLRTQIVTYYKFLYGREPSSSQMDKILWTDVNGKSANYGQFDAT